MRFHWVSSACLAFRSYFVSRFTHGWVHYTRHRALRSNILPPRAETTIRLASPVNQSPAMPRLQEVLLLDPPHGLHSPLDELIFWLNDTAAMHSGAYPQDAISFKNPPALPRSRVRPAMEYCAEHDEDEVPAVPAVDFRYQEDTLNKFQYPIACQGNVDSKWLQGRTNLQHPAEDGAPALGDYSDQKPGRPGHSPIVHRLAKEDEGVKQQHCVKRALHTAGSRGLVRLAKKLSIMISSALP